MKYRSSPSFVQRVVNQQINLYTYGGLNNGSQIRKKENPQAN